MKLPKVSVIIPYKEDRGFLDIAIKSVKDQSYPNIELIICQGDKSVSANINDGIRKATGDYIKYLCEDDWLTPNSIWDSVKAMQGVDFIHGVANNVFESGTSVQHPVHKFPTIDQMLHNNVIHGGTLMYRKEVFQTVGLFNEDLTCAEEYEFNLRCLNHGMILGYTDKILYNYRRHDKQKSLGKGINQKERAKKIQAIRDSIKSFKVVIAIATYGNRDIKPTLNSLKNQGDVIRIYNNEERDVDLTDNGKFFFLQEYSEPIYYITCDDDIIYPPTYVQDIVNAINEHRSIVTHHGRKLKPKTKSYYRGHTQFSFLQRIERVIPVDVAGTGVTGFRTDYFNPIDLYKSEHKCMSDLIFSLEVKKQGKQITLIPHASGYFKEVRNKETIKNKFVNDDSIQTMIADLILNL